MIDVAVIIVSWNARDYLANCLRSVYADLDQTSLSGRVWVVDNNSTDGTRELLEDVFPSTQLIVNGSNPGFGAANNQGMGAAVANENHSPRYFLLLNPDTLVRAGAIKGMVDCLDEMPEIGMVGPRLVYSDGRFQQSAFRFPGLAQLIFDLYPFPARMYEGRLNGRYPRRYYKANKEPFEVDHTLGAAMMVRRDVAEATGGFDESYHMYCEEIDWCWRIRRAGWDIYTVPGAEVVHYSGVSTRQIPARSIVDLWGSRARLYRRHHSRIKFRLARGIVKRGLRRKARMTGSQELKEAYLEASSIWQQNTQPV